MNPLTWSFRIHCLLGAVVCAALLVYALYVQHVLFISPCPMCILQRIAFSAFGLVCLVGAIHGPRSRTGRMTYAGFAALASIAGGVVAAQHVRMQNLPADQVPACGPGLEYMLQAFPMQKVVSMVLQGSGECATVDWTFAGLSMPAWTLVCFVVLTLASLYAGLRRR